MYFKIYLYICYIASFFFSYFVSYIFLKNCCFPISHSCGVMFGGGSMYTLSPYFDVIRKSPFNIYSMFDLQNKLK